MTFASVVLIYHAFLFIGLASILKHACPLRFPNINYVCLILTEPKYSVGVFKIIRRKVCFDK